ncbi:Protein of uncharacterised function(DUF2089) [Acholeplasma oculi]|uniref:DUF2089 domain-containing protein n=1 Tax=Acholeplasma oculi TaxID=35623 RepID=A0A061A9M1_9MOLU|nr:DUF2089 domain-containing protein [Acholeplasma oculi]CDR30563.1 hypothetical protein, DUF2089 [Acholeplasma oculi]SKC47038.1 hypothetical protein SAMN02745122_1261 [Acholeplasma oculi]SUT89247.1 Protein of uncharacterised function(DUF2089) [Acholeplasma oculi]
MSKPNKALTACPVCNHDLHITHLSCDHCHTEIKGEFGFSKFNYLNPETLYFIEIFVKNRGNIKAVEKEMNISYPTVKKYLDEAVTSLGYSVEDDEPSFEPKDKGFQFKFNEDSTKEKKIDILNKIKTGEIKVDEAIKLIKKLKGETK